MKIEEMQIPAPWGHIAAKTWGNETNEAVILSHGFQDNAASFDRLIPLLPTNFYYISIDLPGHGLSSHLPETSPIHYVDFLLAYKVVVDHFKRSKYILLAHSFGGALSLFFAQLYPNVISKLIIIDVVYHIPVDPAMFMGILKNAHDVYFNNLQRKPHPLVLKSYEYKDIVARVMQNRYNGWLTYETADILAKRMVRRLDNGKYVLTLDPKLKGLILTSSTADYQVELFKLFPVTCPVLMLLTPNNDFNDRSSHMLEKFEEAGFCVKTINDHHHVHLTNPEVMADDISNFLTNSQSKL
ncbi:hypothetical protein Trydic_g14494 [Trypoxylus dichotomus]